MKRIVFILLAFFASITLKAQVLEIGVYTEPQFAWISSDESRVSNYGTVFNLNTGMEFNIFFMKNYAFTFGVSLNNQGGKMLYSDSIDFQQTATTLHVPAGSAMKHNLQYLAIPIGLKLKSEEMGYTTFYFHGGLLPMFNLNASTSSTALGYVKENIKPEISLFNFDYYVEAGIEYRLAGNTALIAGLKWTSGFTDVTANDYANNNLSATGLHLGIKF